MGSLGCVNLLPICQLVVIPLSGISGKVLNELPIIAFGIVEINALPMGVRIGNGRLPIPSCREPRVHGIYVIDLIAKVINSWFTGVRDPRPLRFCRRVIQREVRLISPQVDPARALSTATLSPHAKVRKRSLQKASHPINIADDHVGMFEAHSHVTPPWT